MTQPRPHRGIVRVLPAIAAVCCVISCASDELSAADLYEKQVGPFMQKYCVACHNTKKARGELNLTRYAKTSDVTNHFRRWLNIIEFIQQAEMPPKDAKQPSHKERTAVIGALRGMMLAEAKRNAGDPGVILPRRLTRTEYDLSIRELTGVDIQPTKSFPPDPAAGEGFRNTGEALTMSPNLLKKYLAAAEQVANHMVLKPDGITFAPFPVTSYNEQKKLTEQAVIDFYKRHDVRISDYLEAAWRYRYRGPSRRGVSIAEWAQQKKLSPKYLGLVWKTLNEASSSNGYVKQLGDLWNAIPAPKGDEGVPKEIAELNRYIEFCRKTLCRREEQLIRSNAGNWPISHLDFRAKVAGERDRFDPRNLQSHALVKFDRIRAPRRNRKNAESRTLTIQIDPAIGSKQGNYVLLRRPLFSKSDRLPRNKKEEERNQVVSLRSILEKHAPATLKQLSFGKHPQGDALDGDSFVVQAPARIEIPLGPELMRSVNGKHLLFECLLDPKHGRAGGVRVSYFNRKQSGDRRADGSQLLVHADSDIAKKLTASAEVFCRTFPNRFFYVDNQRGLAAGFHLVEGFFRDDRPLVEKVLAPSEVKQLDRLWEELHFITNSHETLLRGFVWFERSERHVLHDKRFDFLRAEDPKLVEEELLGRFERVYLQKMRIKLVDGTLKPEKPSDRFTMIHGFFQRTRQGLARRRALMKAAEERGLRDLEALARRAYRRPLAPKETQPLHALYANFRKRGQSVETALRGVLTAILMSPEFCYQFTETPAGAGVAPLSDTALASRLSFFLWSSLPDDNVLAAAARGQLKSEAALLEQTRRMTKDPKIAVFAREFFGQWLRYRDYLTNDPIIATTFPGYTDDVRKAMFEEPTRLATFLIQNDRPITDLLNSDVTFVNGALAKHYGGEIEKQYRKQVEKWVTDQRKRGVPTTTQPNEVWHRVDGLRKAGRGGLFGMGIILTNNSAGERTSPVKRGHWAVAHLLGQHFPPPPADVPELPKNEKLTKQTIRQLLNAHTAHQKCAMCHKHFDSLGFAMEGFDPIGRARDRDLGGRRIDNAAVFPDGTAEKGVGGLIEYVEKHRRRDFVRTLCRKFLGYALGRSVILSDQTLLDEMEAALAKNNYRFSVLFETVVRSPQFRKQRGREYTTTRR